MITAGEGRTALYRFYDVHERLLYVGITNDPWRRWREHVLEKVWYPQVKHQAVTWYDSEGQARTAETRAIRRERPLFNTAGAVRPPSAWFSVRLSTVQLTGCACFLAWVLFLTYAGRFFRSAELPVDVASFIMLTVLAVMLLTLSAPWFCRFGCWVTRNFGNPDPSRVPAERKVAA